MHWSSQHHTPCTNGTCCLDRNRLPAGHMALENRLETNVTEHGLFSHQPNQIHKTWKIISASTWSISLVVAGMLNPLFLPGYVITLRVGAPQPGVYRCAWFTKSAKHCSLLCTSECSWRFKLHNAWPKLHSCALLAKRCAECEYPCHSFTVHTHIPMSHDVTNVCTIWPSWIDDKNFWNNIYLIL